ncbi:MULTISPECIES: NAD(P)/FAD-dependent oxidoreductase [unclassified Modestobacter]|uniref:NAD(P)/FAD-dependent oxidoreductase n=1 Tax=unclassified Modestobacter TaxID=2643866 RepID=UPI0022AA888B|nr:MULTISPECIES: NAD(P)/FAD-dependent oxidoreductase [unclassified Modestobacter]MCZ2823309.1 NAD(P)/FAD-dependent oxidoreductase [Modestobacter sp. VKM Ac-2981]MCZ2851554.1 NAD(P)/FAD-dependent oxidoreductase [Modestobacter sp. VKM Ac-2982]
MTQTLDPTDTPTTGADDPGSRVAAWLEAFQSALTARDVDRVVELFAPTCFWRDLVSFSWNITTVEGHDGVRDLLEATLDHTDPQGFTAAEPPTGADGVDEAWITFQTAVGRGRGHLRLQDGRAWTLLTTLYELTGHEEPVRDRRPMGAEHGIHRDRETWLDRREREARELGYQTQPYVLVVGGGQGGIALGARLRQLDVPAIVIDKHPRPGDQWRSRYKSLCLHDPVWYDHLPYIKFPDNWPVFAPKDKIADWLESYTRVMELNYWSNTRAISAAYDEATQEWRVTVERDGVPVELRPTQLVLATGMSGKPNVPVLPGQDVFRGDQHHSSAHPGPDAYRGKRCVVIGSNNSAFDICGALWENGADVTMVQRSSTHIVRSESLMEIGLGALYSEEAVAGGMTTEKADLTFASLPYRIMHEFQIPLYDQMRERDADFYQRLEAAGFDHDWGEDGSGLFMKYLRRGSGYYIDVGAADLVANGDVRLVKGQVDHLTEDSVVLADGTQLPADLVVYATGYGSMNGWAADLISQEVADRVGKVWGLGSDTTKDPGPWEGEQRNMWKPTQQEALWFHGGNLHQSRHYSLYLALQLKARQVGIPTRVHRLQEVHHTC